MPYLKSATNGSFSHNGVIYFKIGDFVEVPHHVLPFALEHGYELVSDAEFKAALNPEQPKTTKRPRIAKGDSALEGTE